MTLSEGDMRRALNVLQSTAMAHDEVNENSVYSCTGQPLPNDIAKIVEWMLNEDFSTAYQSEKIFISFGGLALNISFFAIELPDTLGQASLFFVNRFSSSQRFNLYH